MYSLRPSWHFVALLLASAVWTAGGGCSSKSQFQFDELDLVPAQEELTEFSLGKYAIPIPVVEVGPAESHNRRNLVQFDFELIAVVKRDQESRIADSWERHEGKIRDRVIRVCRNASLDDLEELKAHLMDAVQAQLGDKEIRQLVIAEVKSKPL
jgi:flagellar basal body-associated protein FliL